MQQAKTLGPLLRDYGVGYVLAFGAVLIMQLLQASSEPQGESSNGFLIALLASLYAGAKQADGNGIDPSRWTLWLWSLYLTVTYFLLGFFFVAIYLYGLNALLGLAVTAPPYLEKLTELLTQEKLWLAPMILLIAVAMTRLGLGVGLWLGLKRWRRKHGLPKS